CGADRFVLWIGDAGEIDFSGRWNRRGWRDVSSRAARPEYSACANGNCRRSSALDLRAVADSQYDAVRRPARGADFRRGVRRQPVAARVHAARDGRVWPRLFARVADDRVLDLLGIFRRAEHRDCDAQSVQRARAAFRSVSRAAVYDLSVRRDGTGRVGICEVEMARMENARAAAKFASGAYVVGTWLARCGARDVAF